MNIFVANLNFRVSEDELSEIFSEYGDVKSVKIIKDKMSGRSKGFGFIEMDDEEAQSAIDALDGRELQERNIVVNKAKPPRE
ncbi:MAG: RNA-binding protein [Bacteroidetes bacterium]|nr:RNA-binding protein [Bacteroidota bacterium]